MVDSGTAVMAASEPVMEASTSQRLTVVATGTLGATLAATPGALSLLLLLLVVEVGRWLVAWRLPTAMTVSFGGTACLLHGDYHCRSLPSQAKTGSL